LPCAHKKSSYARWLGQVFQALLDFCGKPNGKHIFLQCLLYKYITVSHASQRKIFFYSRKGFSFPIVRFGPSRGASARQNFARQASSLQHRVRLLKKVRKGLVPCNTGYFASICRVGKSGALPTLQVLQGTRSA
jgi:hypothetical protein